MIAVQELADKEGLQKVHVNHLCRCQTNLGADHLVFYVSGEVRECFCALIFIQFLHVHSVL